MLFRSKLYILKGSTLSGTAAVIINDNPSTTNLWHKRLGHISELGMAELVKRELLKDCNMGKLPFCEHCVFGKHKRVKFNASVHTTKVTLDYVHADLWGPLCKPSYSGARCMLTIIPSLMITLEKFDLIFLKLKMILLLLLKNGNL